MRRIRKNSIYDVYCISQYLYQRYSNNLFGVVVEVTDSAVLGGVAEVVSSNPTVGHKNIFSIYRHSWFIIYILGQVQLNVFIINFVLSSSTYIEDLTRVIVSHELYETSLRRVSFISYETTTSVRFCLSYDPLKLGF